MEIITTHINADFDGLASMLAAKKYYPDASLVFPGAQEKSVRDFLSASPLNFDIKKLKEIDITQVTRLILVDVKSPDRIGDFSQLLDKKDLEIHIFDHHPVQAGDSKGVNEIIESVGATTTIMTEMLQKDGISLSAIEATVLMLGIYEETGSLIFPSTTTRDLLAAAWLLQKGANLSIVSNFISRELTPDEIDLLNDLLHSSEEFVIHGLSIKIATAYRDSYMADIASLAHKVKDIDDSDAVFVMVMMDDKVQIIARSQTPEVNVSEILQEFGGGGHTQAASAVIRNLSLVDSVESLKKTLALKIHPAKTALDIMTSPVKTIEYNTTLINAEKSMTRSEINVLPVMKDNELYGIISREGVEKALYHGFAQNSVNDFCTTEPHTVSLDTPISTVESMMIENNLRFMPVMEGSVLRGAITRTDLLRSLYETLLRKSRVRSTDSLSEKPSIGKNLFSVIHTRLPVEVCDLLHLCGKVAADLTFRAYLVGGSVRDILRNESNLDIDIVIEGDGIIFAKELGARLKARVRCHKKFGTASIITDILKFDVATARTEYYESPAALPTVEMSSIKKDLYRRDFTINTMAISLDPERFGVLIDFFGGQRDIKEKTLRILHNLSFIEDPTRAFRAIRFAERFGFRICKHTLNLIKAAVKIELFNKLSGTRIYDELNLLFLETEPVEALKRLSELKLLECAFPGIIITKALEELFRSIQESYNWFTLLFLEEQVNKSHLFLMALLEQITQEKRDSALQRLAVPSKAAQEIASGIKNSGQVLARLKNCSDIDIYEILFPLQLPVIIFTMAKAYNSSQKKAISRYLTKLRGTVPEISGNDLQSMGFTPGPVYRQILSAIIDARLQGSINSKEEELNFIKETFKN